MKHIVRILCLLLALTVTVSAFAACGGSGGETEPEETGEPPVENNYEKDKAEYDAMTAQQLVEKYVADPANITIPEYADLLATYAFVDVEDGSFVYRNKTQEALDLIKEAGGTFPKAGESELAKEMAAKPYAYSRAYYYCFVANFVVPQDSEGYNALKEQYKKETDPFVIACVIRGLSNTFGYDGEFCEFAVSYADSDNAEAKLRLAIALTDLQAIDREELVQAALTLLADPEGNIAYYMAEECGFIGDERLVEPIKGLLENMDKLSVHSMALKGLIRMWYNGKYTSEAAYRITMDYYKAENTDPKYPGWESLTLFTTPRNSNYDKWRAEAAYFNEEEFLEVMKGLVADPEAQKLIKTHAVKVIGIFGTADDLNGLKPLVENSPDKDAILAEIDKELGKK
jgi:hypothetical protein